jgi:hypothetical protein
MSNASTAPIMTITMIIAANPNSTVCVDATFEGVLVGASVGCASITLKLVSADDG